MFLPKHEGELSPNERRVLASAPNTSLGNILSGKFSGEVDTWMEDHFPARNAFVSIYSHMNLYSGRSIVEKSLRARITACSARPFKEMMKQ